MITRIKQAFKTKRLRMFNNFLTVVVLAMSAYIIVLPFFPFFSLWWSQYTDSSNGYRYESQLAVDAGQTGSLTAPPTDNRLVLPGIQIDHTVVEGETIRALSANGVWRRPQTSTPDQGGNTVMVAHRFSYNEPATFYHLDKVFVGERFAVWWEGVEYIYEVFDIVVVDPSQIEIEAPTAEPIMTLYTCTPVWTAKDRLVVRAKLVNTDVLKTSSEGTLR